MRRSLVCRWHAVVLLAAAASWSAAPCRGVEPAEQFQQAFAAGKYDQALDAARKVGDKSQRDELLAQVVQAQIKRGSMTEAIYAAGEMNSDLARTDALKKVVAARGAAGGGVAADFNSLMNLIESTIQPTTWEAAGGPGAMQPYRNGVLVDARGLLKRAKPDDTKRWLASFREKQATGGQQSDARRLSQLRKISLPRLERALELRRAAGLPPDEDMLALAGLERIEYILVYPETNDLVLAGPAGDWQINQEARTVSVRTGRPIVRLDDLITVWRHTAGDRGVAMGCSINPSEANLAQAKAFLDESQKQPLKKGQRGRWLEEVRSRVGRQDIEVFGIDPGTSAARVLVEADYHMKLVGLGIEPSVPGVPNYLEMIQVEKGQVPPAIDVLRWWFTMKYDAVEASPDHNAFAIRGQAVQLQSENEMLTDRGQQVHTNQADPLNKAFAENFTKHFATLCEKYPVYAELQNLFDLALVGTLIETEGLADRVDWHRTYFGVDGPCQVPHAAAPKVVETVVNHRVIGGKHIVAGVSGGVHADPAPIVSAMKVDDSGEVTSEQTRSKPAAELARDNWWWD